MLFRDIVTLTLGLGSGESWPDPVSIRGTIVYIRSLGRKLFVTMDCFVISSFPRFHSCLRLVGLFYRRPRHFYDMRDEHEADSVVRIEVVGKFPHLSLERLAELHRRVRLGDIVNATGSLIKNNHGNLELLMDEIEVVSPWRERSLGAHFIPEPVSVQVSDSEEVCKYWLNTGECIRKHCRYQHSAEPGQREIWVQERVRFVVLVVVGWCQLWAAWSVQSSSIINQSIVIITQVTTRAVTPGGRHLRSACKRGTFVARGRVRQVAHSTAGGRAAAARSFQLSLRIAVSGLLSASSVDTPLL
jgi:hypothetical protein